MSADAENTGTAGSTLVAMFGPAVAVILGVSLWAQLSAFAIRTQLGAEPRPLTVLAFILPFAALAAGVWFRSSIALLAIFPMSLLPPLFLTPDGAAASFADPWSAARVCASFALYLAIVSAWLGAVKGPGSVERGASAAAPRTDYRRHIYTRLVPVLLWWAVPTYAIFWDPAIIGTIVSSYGDDAPVAQIFLATLVFFGWCIVGYMSFIVPSLNLEYDRRKLERQAVAIVESTEKKAVVRRIGLTAFGTVVATGLLLMVV